MRDFSLAMEARPGLTCTCNYSGVDTVAHHNAGTGLRGGWGDLSTPIALTESELERFASKVAANGECWDWTGATGAGGYGVFKIRGRTRTAHRLSLVIKTGENPAYLEVGHRCANPRCVRPDHMRWVTRAENEADKGRALLSPTPAHRNERIEHG